MSDVHPQELMRLLHGELPEERAREIRRRLDGDPALARRYRELAAVWAGLELPPASPPPLGFAARVTARAGERSAEAAPLSWSGTPGWARAAGAAALAAGLAAGVGLGRGTLAPAIQVGGLRASGSGPAVAAPPGPVPAPAASRSAPPAGAGGSEASGTGEPRIAAGGLPAGAGEPPATGSGASTTAATELADDLGAELPGLDSDAGLTAGYWAAIGYTGDLDEAGAELGDEEPRS